MNTDMHKVTATEPSAINLIYQLVHQLPEKIDELKDSLEDDNRVAIVSFAKDLRQVALVGECHEIASVAAKLQRKANTATHAELEEYVGQLKTLVNQALSEYVNPSFY